MDFQPEFFIHVMPPPEAVFELPSTHSSFCTASLVKAVSSMCKMSCSRQSSVGTPGSKSSDLQEPSDDDSEDEENGKDKKKLSDFEDSLKTQIQENKCTKCNESFHPGFEFPCKSVNVNVPES